MKKLVLFFAMLVCSLASFATDVVTAKVSGSNVNVALENETTYCAFQMDITLPTGKSVTAAAAVTERLATGENVTINGASTATPFVVAYNCIDATKNVWRVIAYNLGNNEIKNATGDILTLTLDGDVADAATVSIDNILFVAKSSLEEIDLGTATGEEGGIPGDVNRDGSVDVGDISAIVNIIFGDIDPNYNLDAADANKDGSIDVGDLSAIVNIIFG